MSAIAALFVHNPLNILIVAAVFAAGYLMLQFTAVGDGRQAAALLVPTIGWVLYAVCEWLVMTKTPEANIRVDLMVIWPVLLGLSIWFVIRAFR